MLRAKPFDGTVSKPVQTAEATQANSASKLDGSWIDSVNVGFAITVSCLVIALGLAYAHYVHSGFLFDGVVVLSMSFLPLRILFWLLFKH
jgi:hypothetical protein